MSGETKKPKSKKPKSKKPKVKGRGKPAKKAKQQKRPKVKRVVPKPNPQPVVNVPFF